MEFKSFGKWFSESEVLVALIWNIGTEIGIVNMLLKIFQKIVREHDEPLWKELFGEKILGGIF